MALERTGRVLLEGTRLTAKYVLIPAVWLTAWGTERVVRLTGRSIKNTAVWANNDEIRYSRRRMLITAAGAVAAWETGRRAMNNEWPFTDEEHTSSEVVTENEQLPPNLMEANFPKMPEAKNLQPTSLPFFDADANKEAEKIGVHAGDFIDYDGLKTNRKLTAFTKDKQLLPIFPPSVLQHKEVMYNLSEKYDIPVNVIATIMTMESAGNSQAESNKDNPDINQRAQGLFSVMPEHFIARNIKSPSMWKDRQTNGEVAMQVFKEILDRTRIEHKGKSDVYVYHRALMGYNGGTDAMVDPLPDEGGAFTNWESLIYGDNAMRFALTAQVASQLREKGFNDIQVASRLSSFEIDARGDALGKFYNYFSEEMGRIRKEVAENKLNMSAPHIRARVLKLVEEYQGTKAVLGKEVVTANQTQGLVSVYPHENYKKYLAQTSVGIQRSPGMEVWAMTNGGLIYDQPINREEGAWRGMNTKRAGSSSSWIPRIPEITMPGETLKPKVTLENQLDPKHEGDPKWDGEAACAPTTLGMILKAFGEDATPAKVDKVFNTKIDEYTKQPIHEKGEPTLVRYISEPGKEGGVISWLQEDKVYDVKKKQYEVRLIHDIKSGVEKQTFDLKKAEDFIKKGYLIVGSGLVNWVAWAGPGANHVFGINEVDLDNNQVQIFDPATGTEKWIKVNQENFKLFFFTYAVKPKS